MLTGDDIRAAVRAGRVELHYQPQVAARGGALVGVEGLLRLKREDGSGFVSPSEFIGAAEDSDVIQELGLAVFAKGCADARRWPYISTAINVSPAQFRDPRLPKRLADVAAAAGVNPNRIEIEITEGVFFADPAQAEIALADLTEAGFTISLDDFGTGYCSLGYLLRFPISKIKIDRSFVENAPHAVKAASIVHALTALARALGLKVVAEGVESEAQHLFLRTAGCHILQGFLFSRALPAPEMKAFYQARHHDGVGAFSSGSI